MINWIDRFYNLQELITNKFGIEVTLFEQIPEDLYLTEEDVPYNGTAYLENPDGSYLIDVYGDIEKYPSQMICVLIHEFGHILAHISFGKEHSEMDAWLMGLNYFDEKFIPPNFDEVMTNCLETYK